MSTSKTIIIVSLVLFVFVMPICAQDIFEAARKGDLNTTKH